MSRETIQWLNENTLIGFSDQRGKAWHYRQGSDNHYPGPVPVGDVQRRLFAWEPVVVDHPCPCGCGDTSRIVSRSDTHHRFGTFTTGYQPHNYNEWLLGAVSNILGDTLAIGSAGLLRNGAIAWVQVEVPETVDAGNGVLYRPNLLATTSLDGSVATTYKRTVTSVVCDNTLSVGLSEKGDVFKLRHTRNSVLKIGEAREALKIIHETAANFEQQVKDLLNTPVSDKEWSAFLDAMVPVPEEKGRGRTMAENKREDLTEMWNSDIRVAPWQNTAWGVLAATNTYNHHKRTVKAAAHRSERNMELAIKGKLADEDQRTLETLGKILAAA